MDTIKKNRWNCFIMVDIGFSGWKYGISPSHQYYNYVHVL